MDFFPFTNKEEDSLHNYIARFQHVAPTFTQNVTMCQSFNFSIIHFLYLKNKSNIKYTVFFFLGRKCDLFGLLGGKTGVQERKDEREVEVIKSIFQERDVFLVLE